MSQHVCPIRLCTVRLSDRLLMCRPHWQLVPSALQQAVYAAYDGPESVGRPALVRAQVDAIRAVHEALGYGQAIR